MRPYKYRKYSLELKNEIKRTGNIYLFPKQNIPRSTAQYWKRTQSFQNPIPIHKFYKEQINHLKAELHKEKCIRKLVEVAKSLCPNGFKKEKVKYKFIKQRIIYEIKICQKFCNTNYCLNIIGLSRSTYYRWLSDIKVCHLKNGICNKRVASQLTNLEINKMHELVVEKKYAHMSIQSLHFYAQKLGLLFCSVQTWYKYVNYFDWKRVRKKKEKIIYKIGIRASKPNELWHIDVTEVKLPFGIKIYIQAVIDNFSRYILSWSFSTQADGLNTALNIAYAKENALKLGLSNKTNIMTDGGRENNNDIVDQIIYVRKIQKLIAKVDIHYSNSIVEVLFRSLKHNFLFHQLPKNPLSLKRKVNFYFNQHNNVIPHNAHKGATPREKILGQWTKENEEFLKRKRQEALQKRRSFPVQKVCSQCT